MDDDETMEEPAADDDAEDTMEDYYGMTPDWYAFFYWLPGLPRELLTPTASWEQGGRRVMHLARPHRSVDPRSRLSVKTRRLPLVSTSPGSDRPSRPRPSPPSPRTSPWPWARAEAPAALWPRAGGCLPRHGRPASRRIRSPQAPRSCRRYDSDRKPAPCRPLGPEEPRVEEAETVTTRLNSDRSPAARCIPLCLPAVRCDAAIRCDSPVGQRLPRSQRARLARDASDRR